MIFIPDKNQSEKTPLKKDEHVKEAYYEAEKDMAKDTDLNSERNQSDDLDEGELARLEGHP